MRERHLWRAEEDAPLSLTVRSVGDTAGGQQALVLGFAAVAVAGAAYFATVMITHEGGRTNNVVAQAEEPAPPAASPAPAAAPAAPSAPELAQNIVHDITSIEASAAPPPAAAPAAPTPAAAAPANFPEPVRVKTIQISPPAKTQVASADATAPRQERLDPSAQIGATLAKQPLPSYAKVSAYAEENASKLVSEGIEAVMRQVATEKPDQPKKKPTATLVAATQSETEAPEMAGGMRPARVRSGVNMRARPASGAQVLGTIPSNATISVAPGCQHWCEVTYKGQRGYIYKSFVR